MDKQSIIERLATRKKNLCVRIIVDRPAEVYKKLIGEAGEIRKRSAYSLQLADYASRAPVRAAVEAGERSAPELPAWVERSETTENGIKFWIGKNGKTYLVLPVFGSKNSAKVQWTRNGVKVSKQEIAHFLTAKETAVRPDKSETESNGWAEFNAITLENIAHLK